MFVLPLCDFDAQRQQLDEWLAADPEAAAISDEEAEAFFVVGYALRHLDRNQARMVWKALGVRISHKGERAFRRATVACLQRWRSPRQRQLLLWVITQITFGGLPFPGAQPHRWTDELLVQAYRERVNGVWLVYMRRHLGRAEDLKAWLQSLGPDAERVYRALVDASRLTMRKLLCPPKPRVPPANEAAAALESSLAQESARKDRQSGLMRRDLRSAEQERKRLREQVRRAERQGRAELSQARGEVAAARRELDRRPEVHQRELADRAARFEAELAGLRGQVQAAREEVRRALARVTCHHRADLLQGRRVTVSGPAGDAAVWRLLVESLGGRLVPGGGDLVIDGSGGWAAVERSLRQAALDRMRIRCDGLYRRKGRRPGIAVSGFQVEAGETRIWRQGEAICCGGFAGSMMAEYGALVLALRWLAETDPAPGSQIEIWSDCRDVVGRLAPGRPSQSGRGCVQLHRAVIRLQRLLGRRGCQVRIRWVPREKVEVADRLCDKVYRDQTWYHRRTPSPPSVPLKSFLAAWTGPRGESSSRCGRSPYPPPA